MTTTKSNTTYRDTIESMIKINNKIFTIVSNKLNQFARAVCPNGQVCFIDFVGMKILHRDSQGHIQCEPFIQF